MEAKGPLFFTFFILIINIIFLNGVLSAQPSNHTKSKPLRRSSFPPKFLFGAGSASYQYEGAVKEDGRGPSIWDTYSHLIPSKIADGSNGDVADDFYHRYKEDVNLINFIGLNAFRFSISWSRVLPHGKLSKGVNKAGIAFYNDLINTLLSKGIVPFVTIFHWDLPQALEDEYLGFLSPEIVKDYQDFAELCFKEFGDRVKHWSTFNEPWTFLTTGYDATSIAGQMAPGRCSKWVNKGCPAGDSSTEPYLAGHYILLSHAAASKLYRQKYKPHQKGEIGIVLVSNWFVPFANKKADIQAAQRSLDFFYGWFLDPLTYGDYPKSMRSTVGKRLPYFTPEQSKEVKGSLDFLGVNYYTSAYVSPLPATNSINISYSTDLAVSFAGERNGKPIGAPEGMGGFFDYPVGLKELLVYTKDKYKNPLIYVTENGYGSLKNKTVAENTNDPGRIKLYKGHFASVLAALKLGVNIKGFFAWSLLDNFEWNSGYTVGFGLTYVDFKNGLKRYPKKSAFWFKKFLTK